MTHKLALLAAAAASLTFAGAAAAQTTTTPSTTPPTSTGMPPAQTSTQTPAPADPAATPSASPAESAGAPSSANVSAAFKVGMAVKDSQGVSVGQITGVSTGADGATNVVVTQGGVKFALPGNSLSATADGGVQTTATKAQIDATVAGAKPQ